MNKKIEKMKKLMIGLFVVAFLGVFSVAATGPDKPRKSPEERAAQHTERLEKIVGLTADQKSVVSVINKESAQRMEILMQEMRKIQENRTNKINEVLTDEQREKLKLHKEEMKQKYQGKEKGPRDNKGHKRHNNR